MKSQAEFEVDGHIEELQLNEENRETLFHVQFVKEIEKQKDLSLNQITDSKSKNKIFEYLNKEEVLGKLHDQLKNDPIIQEFMRLSMEEDKKSTFENHFKNMMRFLEKKCKNENEPLTFYNQYTALNKDINSCFQIRKGFVEEMIPANTEYKEILVNKLDCPYKNLGCQKTFKKLAGLNSHVLFCKAKNDHKKEMKDAGLEEDHVPLEKLRNKTKHIEKRRKD